MRRSRPGKAGVVSEPKLTDHNDIWVLRTDFNSTNNDGDNKNLCALVPKNSCLKSSANKGKNTGCNKKSNKCVHYAPSISQEINAKRIKDTPKSSIYQNNYSTFKQNISPTKQKVTYKNQNPWHKLVDTLEHTESEETSSLSYTLSENSLSDTSSLSSLSSLSESSLSSLNSTLTYSLSPPSPSLSLISNSNSNHSFSSTQNHRQQKNVKFLCFLQENETPESETVLNYKNSSFQIKPIVKEKLIINQSNINKKSSTMKKLKLKSDKLVAKAAKSSIIPEAAETITKKLSKKVDFSDFKFSNKNNNPDNTKKKLYPNTVNNSRSNIYDNSHHELTPILTVVPTSLDIRLSASSSYSSQSSPKSSDTTNHTSPSSEDSSFSSNISTTSENFTNHHQTNKSSSCQLPSNSKTVSSILSTSSGVSSNISSASSTTSETPFSDNSNISSFSKPVASSSKNPLQPQYIHQQHAINSRTSNGSNINKKIAPKAVIDEDGDIEIEESKNPGMASFYRDMSHRNSMRLPSDSTKWLQRQASERLSYRVMPTCQFNSDRKSYYDQATAQQAYQQTQNYHVQSNPALKNYQQLNNQQPFSNHLQQSQLAAAAAAAAAMDKEKQRDALVEYMKMQQQKIRNTADSSSLQPQYSNNKSTTTKSNNCNRNSLAYLPRKQTNEQQILNQMSSSHQLKEARKSPSHEPPYVKNAQKPDDTQNGTASILRALSYRCASASNSARLYNRQSTPASISINQYQNNMNYANVSVSNNMNQHVNKTSAKRDIGMDPRRMFSFLQKISSKKKSDKTPECKSSLRRKDSTVSVPSLEFAYNPTYKTHRESSLGLDTTTSSSYRYAKNSTTTDDLETDMDTLRSKSKFGKSNLSLASLSSGYFTTGRYGKHKKIAESTETLKNGLCYLMFGPETKRTLLPSQVTTIDTVKALFVRAFPDKLTMNFLDDNLNIKIYIKDQLKELFYELDEMNDVKDKCVLKLVDLNEHKSSPTPSLVNQSPVLSKSPTKSSENSYYHLTQSNFLEPQPSKINEYYSSPVTKIQAPPTTYRYNPIIQQTNTTNPTNLTTNQITNQITNLITNTHGMAQPISESVQAASHSLRSLSEPRHSKNFLKKANLNLEDDLLDHPETYDNINDRNHQSRIYATTTCASKLKVLNRQLIDKDFMVYNSQSNKLNSNIPMGVNAKLAHKIGIADREPQYSEIKLEDLCMRSRSESLTPKHQHDIDLNGDLTEDDITYSMNSCFKNKNMMKQLNQLRSTNLNILDEEDYKSSKAKMRMMQEQLETLTNLVHKALANKDLNQLHGHFLDQEKKMENSVHASRSQRAQDNLDLQELNLKTRKLRQDLKTVRNLHQTLNISFGDSMKNFINQLNDKLNSFCRNDTNEKIKMDLIVYKYQLDSEKIESELSDLENVVDDLRRNILKRKCEVSIDDVECYALALSQLSKQLVGLKCSFGSIREHLKNVTNNKNTKYVENRLAIGPRVPSGTASLNRAMIKKKTTPSMLNSSNTTEHVGHMKNLLDEIENIKPDHEHRRLAVEVDNAFAQLMSEISMVASEINTSLIKKTESLSRGSSLSPMRSISRNNQLDAEPVSNGSKQSRLVYPKFYANSNKTSVHSNKIELILGDNGKEAEHKLSSTPEAESRQIPLFISESNVNYYLGNESDAIIEKRNKFRAQKNAIKEEKERAEQLFQNDCNGSNDSNIESSSSTSSSSVTASNSPSSSFASSPCRTPAPSSPLSNFSTSPTPNQNESTQICNNLSQTAPTNQAPITSGHIKIIDRSFHLETVQEEENTSQDDDLSSASTVINSVADPNAATVKNLYEQLNNLKPLKSNIPVAKEPIKVNNMITSSMMITPKSNWDTIEASSEVRTISSSSSTSSCGSSSGYNSDSNVVNNNNIVSRCSGLKKSGDFFKDLLKEGNTKAVSSMVIPRRSMNSPGMPKRASLSVTDL